MHYRLGFKAYLEVKRGLMDYLTRMGEDEDEQTLIDVQMDVSTPNFVRANKIILKYKTISNKNKNVCYYLNKKRVLILFYFMNKVKIKFVKKEKK